MTRVQQDLAVDLHASSTSSHTDGVDQTKMLRRLAAKTRKPKVAIVGAGFAGLRAADVLLKQNVDVTIFEARDRVGGRVCHPSPQFTVKHRG